MSSPSRVDSASLYRALGLKPSFARFFLVAFILGAFVVLGWTALQPDLGSPFLGFFQPSSTGFIFDAAALLVLLVIGLVALASSNTPGILVRFILFSIGLSVYEMLIGSMDLGLGTLVLPGIFLAFAMIFQRSAP